MESEIGPESPGFSSLVTVEIPLNSSYFKGEMDALGIGVTTGATLGLDLDYETEFNNRGWNDFVLPYQEESRPEEKAVYAGTNLKDVAVRAGQFLIRMTSPPSHTTLFNALLRGQEAVGLDSFYRELIYKARTMSLSSATSYETAGWKSLYSFSSTALFLN
ncbi:hypothetical protein Tco_1354835 [Tanacetum coccineum]